MSLLLVTAVCFGLLPGCQRQPQKCVREIYGAFDTVIQLTVYTADLKEFDRMASLAEQELLRLSQLYDIYVPYQGMQGLYWLNSQAGQGPVPVEPEVLDLLEFGVQCYQLTQGRVNIAMGAVLSLWHQLRMEAQQDPDQAKLPEQKQLEQAAQHCRIEDLIWDRQAGTAQLLDPEMRLDVGAVAKGYAVQLVTQRLEQEGYHDFVIFAGGNVQAQGAPPDRQYWTVGIAAPQDPGELEGAVEVSNMAVVTSGGYQRFYTVDGKQYHHIIDPETLFPGEKMLSATVICPESGLADCLSTALFLMEPDQAIAFIRTIPNARAILVTLKGKTLDSEMLIAPDREDWNG